MHSHRLSHASLSAANAAPPAKAAAAALTPEAVSSAWLASLTLSLLSHLSLQILLNIKSVTDTGAAQLAEDLGYLVRIVKALNVEWVPLDQWKEGTEMGEDVWKKRLAERKQDGKDVVILTTISRMRGWKS
jgi:hypothetical protein